MISNQKRHQPSFTQFFLGFFNSIAKFFFSLKSNLFKNLDIPLIIGILCLMAISLTVLASAQLDGNLVINQLYRFIFALVVMLFFSHLSPRILKDWAYLSYIAVVGLLVVVLVTGHISKGAQRWLDLGFIKFQPAEFMKIVMPVVLCKFLDNKYLPISFVNFCIASAILLIPFLLVALQPDLGTAILIACSGGAVIFFAGIRWRWIFYMLTMLVVSVPILWGMLRQYQQQRILTLLDPERDPLGKGYHIIQSKIAIGSGGLYGKGWFNGTQSQLEFLPERTTDFIFAVFSEEFGFIGVALLITIYFAILMRCIVISLQSPSTFTRLLGAGLTASFFVYVMVNIGMVSGILPVVGVPLPLVSYGGSSIVTIMVGFGIIMSLNNHKPLVKS